MILYSTIKPISIYQYFHFSFQVTRTVVMYQLQSSDSIELQSRKSTIWVQWWGAWKVSQTHTYLNEHSRQLRQPIQESQCHSKPTQPSMQLCFAWWIRQATKRQRSYRSHWQWLQISQCREQYNPDPCNPKWVKENENTWIKTNKYFFIRTHSAMQRIRPVMTMMPSITKKTMLMIFEALKLLSKQQAKTFCEVCWKKLAVSIISRYIFQINVSEISTIQ